MTKTIYIRRLYSTTSLLLPLHNISGSPDGHQGGVHTQTPVQPPRHQVAATLLLDMWIHLDYSCHHNGARQPSLNPGLPGANDRDQRSVAPVGGW